MNRHLIIAIFSFSFLLLAQGMASAQDTVYIQGSMSFDYDQWPFGGINGSFQAEGLIDEATGLPVEGNSGVGGGLRVAGGDTVNAMVTGLILNDDGTVDLTAIALQFLGEPQPGDYPVDVNNLTAGFIYLDQVSNFTIPESNDVMAWFDAIEADAKYVSTSGTVTVDQVDDQFFVGSFSGIVADPATFVMLSVENGVFATDNDVSLVPVPEAAAALALKSWPNPFNPMTTVSFSLAEAGNTTVAIYDVAGHQVRTLHEGPLSRGDHSFNWNGSDDRGIRQGAGQYLCRVRAGTASTTLKLMLVP